MPLYDGKGGWQEKVEEKIEEEEKRNDTGAIGYIARSNMMMSDTGFSGKKANDEEAEGKLYDSEIGQYGEGNIDLYDREPVETDDGRIATVNSFSVNIDGQEVLLPTVIDGRLVSEDEAIDHYYETGEYLGKFDTVKEADEYARKLHLAQQYHYSN
jgi:hypothetical protein